MVDQATKDHQAALPKSRNLGLLFVWGSPHGPGRNRSQSCTKMAQVCQAARMDLLTCFIWAMHMVDSDLNALYLMSVTLSWELLDVCCASLVGGKSAHCQQSFVACLPLPHSRLASLFVCAISWTVSAAEREIISKSGMLFSLPKTKAFAQCPLLLTWFFLAHINVVFMPSLSFTLCSISTDHVIKWCTMFAG